MKKTAILLLALLAVACATDPAAQQREATRQMEHKMQVYGPACEKLGHEKNSDGWRECVQREYEQTLLRQQQLWDNRPWNPYLGPPDMYRPCYPVKGGWRCP